MDALYWYHLFPIYKKTVSLQLIKEKMQAVFVLVLKVPLRVPWAVLTLPPCVVVVCVLNTCSPYPCHSGHRIVLHRRLPGLAQLATQEHQEHELRQPCVPQDHGGRRRRDPHRPAQRLHWPRLSASEWQPQPAVHSASTRGRRHRQQLSLVFGCTNAFQWQMKANRLLKFFNVGRMHKVSLAGSESRLARGNFQMFTNHF